MKGTVNRRNFLGIAVKVALEAAKEVDSRKNRLELVAPPICSQ